MSANPPPAAAPSALPSRDAEAASREISASHRLMHVTERELQRILLDIHDGPVQHMYAALSQLDLLRRALEAGGHAEPEVADRMGRIRQLLESGLNEVRSFIGAFRPPEFEARDLVTLVEGLAMQHEAHTDTRIDLVVDAPLPEVPLPVKIALYRVLQEGLSNAYRHGGADRVAVRMRRVVRTGGPRLRVSVSDNGHGFDPGTVRPEKHFGVDGMRDRVEMIGGRFRLRSSPSRGTTIAVEVPL
ncbi:MAG: histidine kinase [Gemmatimonadetes bacterium]|nr:histidine kinase [Gemmatimonadota bacterium]